jgi:hypothetical protein
MGPWEFIGWAIIALFSFAMGNAIYMIWAY